MKDKILFLTDGWFFNFGAAYYLQNLEDYEFYAIFDVDDKARNFYENQNLIKYHKSWFYLDAFNKNYSPDVEYLSNFEKKYNLNLWSIVYTDRALNQYNNFYTFSYLEILSILEQECRFFEKILDEIKPNFISMYIPISHHQLLFCKLAKSKGIKILMFTPVRLGGRMMISEEAGMPDNWTNISNSHSNPKTFEELQNFLKNFDSSKAMSNYKKAHFESHKKERYLAIWKFLFSKRSKNYDKRFSNYGKNRTKIIRDKISRYVNRKLRDTFMNKNFKKSLKNCENIIYFPLHSEPERALLVAAKYYTNQLSVITNIAKSLPMGYKLIVKEHPGQSIYGWRKISYYKKIMDLPNVEMVHHSISSTEVIKKSSLVISIGGTASLEGLFYKKPTIVFTEQLYTKIPGVYKISNFEELPDAIKSCINKDVNSNGLSNFVDNIQKHSFKFSINGLMEDFSIRFGFKGTLMDAVMPIDEVKSYLEDHKSEFEKLALEHQNKIKQHNCITEQK